MNAPPDLAHKENDVTDQDSFVIFGIAAAGWAHPGIATAVARAGGIGILDLEFCRDEAAAERNFLRLAAATDARIGLRLTSGSSALAQRLIAALAARPLSLVFAGGPEMQADAYHRLAPSPQHRVYAEITHADAAAALTYPHHGLIAKGHEAGGWIGADTSYILAQKLLGESSNPQHKPIYVQGGIGVHSAAACRVLGAAGVVLDDQLLLLAESPLPESQQSDLARLNGGETRLFGELIDTPCRVFARPGSAALKAAEDDNRKVEAGEISAEIWRERLGAQLGWGPDARLIPLGQGIGVAATYRTQYRSVGRLVQALRKSSINHIGAAATSRFLSEGGALAVSHGTRFPLAQGPMTRVSDSPQFAYEVSRNGALPFLALALMRGPQVLEMLQQTRRLMTQGGGELPWGVGMLGFIPHALREEQSAAIWQCKPPFALIAGGRPDQAAEFESHGIATYIHAPAPALLKIYIEQGAKRFVFEGRECGGHIGPLASFALWEQMVEVLLAEVRPDQASEFHVLFAGGIHDASSAAMLAALTAPLAARGFKVGALMGTAYLFTTEIVASGAVVAGFQEQALACRRTVNLESGPGHSTRCADTRFGRDFYATRRRLLREGRSTDELRDALEDLNLGRLRVASKGLDRDASGQIVAVAAEKQVDEGMYMIGQVATLRDRVLTIAELHRDVTEGATQKLNEHARASLPRPAAAKPADIAIIGIGTLLPKAHEADRYWENILDQVCVIGEVPKERWDWKLYFDADRHARDKIYSRWGGFLDEVAFDPIAYGIPPNSMKSIDPMQLLTLEVTRRALADAGLADGNFDRENTSIIIGAGGGLGDLGTQYAVRAELPRFVENLDANVWSRLPEWTEESFAGSLLNVAAGRVANRLDFGGVNFTIDAACASSLAAIAMAVDELETGRSNVAIAGGVDTVQSAFGFMSFSKTQALSPTGQPRAFDQAADGIAISEGLAMVVLKRLADAERDGDRIYAVIKGVAGSSDGKALGMTAPRPEGQKRALARAYARAGFSPKTLGMIEAHGTGTPVGDRAEAQTITETLLAEGTAAQSCAIGSVKNLLGHTKASAGACGLIKSALSLHHRTLPAHYGVARPIDSVGDPRSPVYLLKDARPWLAAADHPRRAGVSAFGFGGTNFHAVLEEYTGGSAPAAAGAPRWPYELFVFRARDEATLAGDLGRLIGALRSGNNLRLRDLAFSFARQADSHGVSGCCLAIVARDATGLLADLEAALTRLSGGSEKPLPQSVRLGNTRRTHPPQLAFLFPGQGSQYVNMGREAALYIDELRTSLELVDATLLADFPAGLSRTILPPAAFDVETENRQAAAITDTRAAQPAIGAIALGYLRFVRRLGLTASAVGGHSYGEYAALCAAGVLTPADFLRLSAVRGQCMADAARSSQSGAMAAVQAHREKVASVISAFGGVRIANHNAPEQVVISGPASAVEAAVKQFEADGVRTARLPVSGAFHTELMTSAQLGLSAAIDATPIGAPGCAVYCNTTAQRYPEDAEGIRRTLDAHLLNSVEFVAEIEAMYAAGCRVFVELGPKGTCSNMARAILAGRDAVAVSLDGQGGGLRGMLLGLAELAAAGVAFEIERLFDSRDARALDLERLADLVKPALLPKYAWWVNGGSARQLEDPIFRTGTMPALNAETAADAREAARLAIAPAAPAVVAPASAATLPAAALSADAVVAYQQTMRQFLNLQERVIQQFLGGSAGVLPAMPVQPAIPAGVVPIAAARAPAAPSIIPVQASHAVEIEAAQLAEPAFDVRACLLEIVAERTGYPQDMLGIEQDLEAELGIDSIKRVEILGALRKRLPAPAAELMKSGMERYTRAKTLAAILAQATQDLAAATPIAVSTSGTIAASAAALDRDTLKLQLLAIVAERTGYPTEMLGLRHDLEAELGIDSIKRVEILGALRKSLPEAYAQAMQAGMEKFTKARSLDAILDAALAINLPGNVAKTAAAPVPAGRARTALQSQLLAIVAERTGYPVEMLGLGQDLEAELGIDSIKRIEILGAMRKTLPADQSEAMQRGMEKFTKARSLNAILDALMSSAPIVHAAPDAAPPSAPTAAPAPPAADSPVESERIPRYLPRSHPAPLPAQRHPLDGIYLLTADRGGVAERLADRIVGAGGDARLLAGEVLVDADQLSAAFEKARAGNVIKGLVHLAGLERIGVDGYKQGNQRQAKALFRLMQLCAPDFAAGDAVILAASKLGGSLGRESSGSSAAAAGAALGMFNCAVAEWPKLRARQIDFADGIDADAVADALFDELVAAESRREIGYRHKADGSGTERIGFVHSAETLQIDSGATGLRPDAGWTILVTGGARGITAKSPMNWLRKPAPGCALCCWGAPLNPASKPRRSPR